MKVRMKVDISGTRDGVAWPKRDGELTVSDREGADLCAQGLADPVAAPPVPERRPAVKKSEKR